MIPFFDASSADHDVPIAVIRHLHQALVATGTDYVIIGAGARDLVVHCPANLPVNRATKDVDIAVAGQHRQGCVGSRSTTHRIFLGVVRGCRLGG